MDNSLKTLKTNQQLQIWSELVKDCRSSGLTVKTWCANKDIKLSTYYAWQKRVFQAVPEPVEETALEQPKIEFAEVPREHLLPASNQLLAATIVVGETSVDIYNCIQPQILQGILMVLKS